MGDNNTISAPSGKTSAPGDKSSIKEDRRVRWEKQYKAEQLHPVGKIYSRRKNENVGSGEDPKRGRSPVQDRNAKRNMIEYKRYDRSREDEVLKVFIEAFVNYPLFWGVFEGRFSSETKLRSFYEHLMKGIFRATIRKNDCYMGVADGKVASVVIVEKPSDKPVGFWDYAVSGMAGIIARIGLRDTLRFMEMSDKTEIVVKSIPGPRWHLYFLAVDPKFQRRGIGSGAIHEFLIPLVRSNGGDLITVTTNSGKNVPFYINNGFTLVKEETLECNERSIENWTFRMDLKHPGE